LNIDLHDYPNASEQAGLTGIKIEPAFGGFYLFSFCSFLLLVQKKELPIKIGINCNQPKFFLFAHAHTSKLKKLRFALFVDSSRTRLWFGEVRN
jgi:hypothetical protein